MNLFLAALLSLLGSDSWQMREAAADALVRLGPAAVLHLELAAASPDPEIRSRAERLLLPWYRAWLEQTLAQLPLLPYIDALPRDWPGRAGIIGAYVFTEENEGTAEDATCPYRTATAAWLRDQIGCRMRPAQIAKLLPLMLSGERFTD